MYYQTPAGGYGEVNDPANLPPDAVEITESQYNALVAQTAADQAAANAAELAAARARWTQVRDDLVTSGVTVETAEILADAVGARPVE